MDTPPRNGNDVARYAVFLAVNHDRAAVGLSPLRYTEFINVGNLLRGARDYWTPEKLAEKAKKQLRDPKTKRWITQRGSIPGKEHRAARARIGKDGAADDEMNLPGAPKAKAKGAAFTLGPPPRSSPTTKVTRLTGDDAIEAMARAGHDRKVVEARYRDRGVIFQVDNPGRNPVAVFVANPRAMVEHRMLIQDNNVVAAKDALASFKQEHAAKIEAGDPQALAKLQEHQRLVDKARVLRAKQKLAAEAHYGNGGDETIGEMEQLLAAEAAALHMEAISGWPAWKLLREDGTPLPFALEFDESKLVEGEKVYPKAIELPMASIVKTIPGRAEDGNRIILNRNVYRKPLSEVEAQSPGFFTPSDRETVGQHASAHEPGHLLDPRDEPDDPQLWDSAGAVFHRLISAANYAAAADPKAFPYASTYAKKSQREWYAEMHAMASADWGNMLPQQQVAVMAYLSTFMLGHAARPGQPTAEWVAANEDWLRRAYRAVGQKRKPPALPDPAEFFEMPRPRVYKNPKWKLPGQKE